MYNWIFGWRCGLTWNETRSWPVRDLYGKVNTELSGLPTAFDVLMQTSGGTTTMSTKTGSLVMYSNYESVFNKNENNIAFVSTTAHHSGDIGFRTIAVPYPGKKPGNYVVVSGASRKDLGDPLPEFYYTEIDMNLNGGLGGLTQAMQKMPNPTDVPGPVAAVRHANGEDYWIVAVCVPSHNYYPSKAQTYINAWLLTKNGMSSTPVVSNLAMEVIYQNNSFGQIKLTPDGRNFVWTPLTPKSKTFYYGDFDDATGQVSNVNGITLPGADVVPEYIEYSPDISLVYISANPYHLFVFKAEELFGNTSATYATVDKKRYVFPFYRTGQSKFGSMLQSPIGDERIYATSMNNNDFYILENTNDFDNLKIYKTEEQTVGEYDRQEFLQEQGKARGTGYGLPLFPASFFLAEPEIKAFGCTGNDNKYTVDITVTGTGPDQPVKLRWDFGDGSPVQDQPLVVGVSKYTMLHAYAASGIRNITVTPVRANGTSLKAIKMPVNTTDCSIRTNRMIRTDLQNSKTIQVNR